MTKVKAKD